MSGKIYAEYMLVLGGLVVFGIIISDFYYWFLILLIIIMGYY